MENQIIKIMLKRLLNLNLIIALLCVFGQISAQRFNDSIIIYQPKKDSVDLPIKRRLY